MRATLVLFFVAAVNTARERGRSYYQHRIGNVGTLAKPRDSLCAIPFHPLLAPLKGVFQEFSNGLARALIHDAFRNCFKVRLAWSLTNGNSMACILRRAAYGEPRPG